jgi:hypothetical protein
VPQPIDLNFPSNLNSNNDEINTIIVTNRLHNVLCKKLEQAARSMIVFTVHEVEEVKQ